MRKMLVLAPFVAVFHRGRGHRANTTNAVRPTICEIDDSLGRSKVLLKVHDLGIGSFLEPLPQLGNDLYLCAAKAVDGLTMVTDRC
jgi:hypothetical protein